MSQFVCIGVPYWLGARESGRNEVEIVKHSGILDTIPAMWIDLEPEFSDYDDPVIAVNRALAEVIQSYPEHIPLIFAQDCTSCWGAVTGLQTRLDPAVVWYDAHGDFNTPETTPSGFLGGMPLAAMVGRGNRAYIDAIGLRILDESHICITDVRDLDPEEHQMLANSEAHCLWRIEDTLTMLIPEKPVYLHFDTDVMNLGDMPAVAYPAAGGENLETISQSVQHMIQQSEIAAILFTLWNNRLNGADKSRRTFLKFLATVVNTLQ